MDSKTAFNISLWLNGCYDEETKKNVRHLVQNDLKEAIDAFYTDLSFGTGGMRGLMGIGSNRLNDYTVRATTQGLANYINYQPASSQGHSVFIGFDSRHHSHKFAEEAAKVMAAKGIRVFLCKDIRPTPLVSFGCRLKKCTAAIMITASHNPSGYNGYKVYWSDGGQVLPPHDTGIMQEISKVTDPIMVEKVFCVKHPLITFVSEEIDAAYINEATKLQYYPEENCQYGKDLKIVYTSLHGTGITLTPKMLKAWGFSNILLVDEQVIPDGNFPTAKFPNPEEKAALTLGIKKILATESDLLIATDPDADRVGIAVLHHHNVVVLNGNQIACLCLEHICEALTAQGKMPENAAFIKTIATTELFQSICDFYNKPCFNVLTGFKYIAEKILKWEKDLYLEGADSRSYIFGAEESYGYLFGTLTRDKDAVLTAALISQMALQAKRKNRTLVDLLYDLYRKYGVFVEDRISVSFNESKDGKEKMKQRMNYLRQHMQTEIQGIAVTAVEDYLSSLKTDFKTGNIEKIYLPTSDVLLFKLTDGSKLIIRPSGTEPKIKLYCDVNEHLSSSIEETIKRLQNKAANLLSALKHLMNLR